MESVVIHKQKVSIGNLRSVYDKSNIYKRLTYEDKAGYGGFVWLKPLKGGKLEAFVANNSGVMFGATLLNHYQDENFIFTTRFVSKSENKCAVLIVHKRQIMLETIVLMSELPGLFKSYFEEDDLVNPDLLKKINYVVYDFDGGIRDHNDKTDDSDSYSLSALRQKRFNRLTEYPFHDEEIEKAIAKPFKLALKERGIYSKEEKSRRLGIGLFSVAFVFLAGTWFYSNLEAEVKLVDEYKAFKSLMTKSSVNVNVRMSQLYNMLTVLTMLEGWDVSNIKIKGAKSIIELKQTSGNLRELEDWIHSSTLKFKLQVKKNGIRLELTDSTSPVAEHAFRMKLDDLTPYLNDSFAFILPEAQIAISDGARKSGYKNKKMSIQLGGHSKFDLERIGSVIDGLPVGFLSANLNYETSTGTLKGVVELVAIGI